MIQPSVFVSVFFFSLRCIHLVFSSSSFSLIQSKPQTRVLFWRTTIAFSLYLGTKRLASSLPVNPLKNSGAFVSGIETEGTSLEFLMDASISQLDRTTTTLLSRHVSWCDVRAVWLSWKKSPTILWGNFKLHLSDFTRRHIVMSLDIGRELFLLDYLV
jgi:hypothetical protein